MTDIDAANRFYGEVLGLKRNPNSPADDWVEYEAGNVTLAVMTPHSHDYAFTPLPAATIALRVPDLEAARRRGARRRGLRAGLDVGLGRLQRGRRLGPGRQPHPPPPPLRAVSRRIAALMDVERVDFVSVLTQDIARAKEFYAGTLGLEVETEGEHDMELRCGQVTLDVFDPSSIEQPFAVSPAGLALRVPDVDAARQELEAKGVEFDGETIETGVCKQAFVQGSRRQRAHAPPEVRHVMKVAQVDFVSIASRDVSRSVAWYRDVLGLPESDYNDGEVETANVTLGFWNPESDGEPFVPNPAGIGLRVGDVHAAVAEAEEAGAEVIGIEDTGVCHMGFVKDPDGNS